jgi:hypothetical protein
VLKKCLSVREKWAKLGGAAMPMVSIGIHEVTEQEAKEWISGVTVGLSLPEWS